MRQVSAVRELLRADLNDAPKWPINAIRFRRNTAVIVVASTACQLSLFFA